MIRWTVSAQQKHWKISPIVVSCRGGPTGRPIVSQLATYLIVAGRPVQIRATVVIDDIRVDPDHLVWWPTRLARSIMTIASTFVRLCEAFALLLLYAQPERMGTNLDWMTWSFR